jgi:hypothetical protein
MQVTNREIPELKALEVEFEVKNGDVCVEKVEAFIEYLYDYVDVTELFAANIKAMMRLERVIQSWFDESRELVAESARENQGMLDAKELGA